MLIILTSAKTMTGTSKIKAPVGTTPRFTQEAMEIALNMAQFSADELKKILKLNPKLALENYNRFQEFHSEENHSLQAILAYTGVVFKNLAPKDFTPDDFRYMNDHLRIASICYGLLRPLDLIKTYRMEYEVKLPELGEGNMYNYWRPRQTQTLIDDVKANDNILINLASQEIQGAYNWKEVEKAVRIITPEFKVWKDGKAQTIVIYTKMARGQMTRYILKNRITDPEELKQFSWEGFTYDESMSEGDNWVFLQS
ncbi:peroxide stress protein YaaA [Parabacteroides timonensis]|uniref:peroxide stress protein YaaA n=1 Tax=Parabacteroides timonensis TaxID=1871013 RepID=UPI00094E3E79|nr:peroxide stress protein YaaA [Parabacteroides timonensis]